MNREDRLAKINESLKTKINGMCWISNPLIFGLIGYHYDSQMWKGIGINIRYGHSIGSVLVRSNGVVSGYFCGNEVYDGDSDLDAMNAVECAHKEVIKLIGRYNVIAPAFLEKVEQIVEQKVEQKGDKSEDKLQEKEQN